MTRTIGCMEIRPDREFKKNDPNHDHSRRAAPVEEATLEEAGGVKRVVLTLALSVIALLVSSGAFAWNGIGHEVVARIAWEDLAPEVQAEAVRLLAATRPEVELRSMRPSFGGRRDQILFERAATWPDYVRSAVPSENRSRWHYTNYFWKQEEGRAVDLPEMKPADENVATELPRLIRLAANKQASDHDRGIALAWVLHLVGDIHQPLHCSARVTELDPRGDRGGNSFKLEPALPGIEDFRRNNLHSLWDGAVSRVYPKSFWESQWRYRERLVDSVDKDDSTTDTFVLTAAEAALDAWIREGFELAKNACYPSDLIRDQPANERVLSAAAAEAKKRMALAGHRLAAVLESIL